MDIDNNVKFLYKLKALLNEFDVSMQFNCDESSDMGGVYDARIEFVDNHTHKPIFRTNSSLEINASDITFENEAEVQGEVIYSDCDAWQCEMCNSDCAQYKYMRRQMEGHRNNM